MPSKRKELINPVRVFFAIVIVVIIWFAPIAFPLRAEKLTATKEASPLTYVFASSADACPYSCIICTSWETGKWPKGCLTWRCDVDCENSGGGGGNQPPTISHVLNCAQPGSNGWCKGNLSLDLTASDPQGSQVIISGDVNGTAFACPSGATTCFIPLSEGAGNANYKVDAAATGLSASGNTTYLLDSSTPQLNGSASGVVGTNGWYKSNVTLSVESSDVVSGIASTSVTVDGGPQTAYSAPIVLTDGIHTVVLTTTDNAGHVTQTTQTFNIDTVTPVLNVSLSGSVGANNWYISDVTITPSANDSDSGLASLEATMDGRPWAVVNSPLLFTDGIHSYQFRARDNAGNVTETAMQEIKVDATTPAISLKVNGTRGQNDWYVSDASVTPTATDATSGIATLEVSQDNSPFTNSQSPITFSDGLHRYQFRITDNAGNTTQIPTQQIKIDTVFPIIAMADELKLGETLYYDLEDPTTRSAQVSGLWINRQVIEDDAEKYKKVVWQEVTSGNKAEGDILWDGVFADGVKADAGEYFITLKISDAAGNETMRTTIVKVNALRFLQIIPPFTPPQTTTLPVQTTQTDSAAVTEFGGTNSGATGAESASITAGGTAVFHSDTDYVQSGFTQGNETTSTPITNSGILWGAVATAILGATLVDWQRKREKEEARKRAESAAREEEGGSGRKTPGQRAYEKMMKQKHIVGESQVLLYETARQKAEQAELARQNLIAKNEDRAPVNMAKVNQLVEVQKKADLQTGLSAYYEGRKMGEEKADSTYTKQETWQNKAWNWAFNNQVELSLGTGIVAGLAAVAIVATAAITAPAWIIVGGAVLATAAIITLGTVAINSHFGLNLGNNLATNLVVGTAATLITAGVGIWLTNLIPVVSTTVATTCTQYATACAQIGTIIDSGEEALLAGQVTYYTWIGDQDNAAQAALELQFEMMDGGAPGNSVALELSEQIEKLGPDAAELISKHGDDIIPLLLKYGNDAVDIIGAYGDEGIALLLKYGDDTPQAIKLVRDFGTPAVQLMNTLDVKSVGRLLHNLEPDVLEYAVQQSPDAVSALSKWKPEELKEFGVELALRAENDAKVIADVKKLVSLGPIDISNLTNEQQELIDAIAKNSTQYSDGGQVVLGNWFGLGDGYAEVARDTGSVSYVAHPDLWPTLGELGEVQQNEAAWLINKQVLQPGIENGLPFEYTLNGIKPNDLNNEKYALKAVWSGATDEEIMDILGKEYVPARIKELRELEMAGYEFSFDLATNSYILIKP